MATVAPGLQAHPMAIQPYPSPQAAAAAPFLTLPAHPMTVYYYPQMNCIMPIQPIRPKFMRPYLPPPRGPPLAPPPQSMVYPPQPFIQYAPQRGAHPSQFNQSGQPIQQIPPQAPLLGQQTANLFYPLQVNEPHWGRMRAPNVTQPSQSRILEEESLSLHQQSNNLNQNQISQANQLQVLNSTNNSMDKKIKFLNNVHFPSRETPTLLQQSQPALSTSRSPSTHSSR